jgi:hypothetical protein
MKIKGNIFLAVQLGCAKKHITEALKGILVEGNTLYATDGHIALRAVIAENGALSEAPCAAGHSFLLDAEVVNKIMVYLKNFGFGKGLQSIIELTVEGNTLNVVIDDKQVHGGANDTGANYPPIKRLFVEAAVTCEMGAQFCIDAELLMRAQKAATLVSGKSDVILTRTEHEKTRFTCREAGFDGIIMGIRV